MVRLEPILYRVVTLTREGEARRFITCLHRQESPRSFVHAAVKSLCIYDCILGTTALEILYDCTGVTSLAIWIITAAPVLMQEHINTLPLKKLSLHMTSVFSTPPFIYHAGHSTGDHSSWNPRRMDSINWDNRNRRLDPTYSPFTPPRPPFIVSQTFSKDPPPLFQS